jgi:hypothetical protein
MNTFALWPILVMLLRDQDGAMDSHPVAAMSISIALQDVHSLSAAVNMSLPN